MAAYHALHNEDLRRDSPTGIRSSSQSRLRDMSQTRSLSASRAPRTQARVGKDVGAAGQASWLSGVINLVNTIVGAGVLAMPIAMSHMGILLGTLFIAWAGVTAGFGLYLQTRCARYLDRGKSSFFALSQLTYPKASVIFDAAIAIKCFGVGVSYLIIIGDLMPGVVSGFTDDDGRAAFLVDRRFWITAFMLIVIPFSFLRRLDSLKYTSIIALMAIAYLAVLVVYHFGVGDTIPQRGHVSFVRWGGFQEFLASLPVIVFAYTCHQNMFSILNELKDNSPLQTNSMVMASTGSSGSLYILVAITGYLSFGDTVNDNIVSMYIPSAASTIGRLAIVIMVMFSYPLQVHPCRASVDAVIKYIIRHFSSGEDSERSRARAHSFAARAAAGKSGQDDGMSEGRFATITTMVIICSYMVAMTVSSLGKVLAYVGSTGSTSISFILPGLFYYKISAPDSPHHQRLLKEDDDEEHDDGDLSDDDDTAIRPRNPAGWRRALVRKLALALAIYGICVMVVCLISNTYFNAVH